jgi:subtilisin family serine protease
LFKDEKNVCYCVNHFKKMFRGVKCIKDILERRIIDMEKNTCRPYFCNIFALIFGCTAIFAGIESAIAETISMFTPRPDTLISGLKANAAASKLQTGKIIWKDKKSISMSPAMEQNSIYWYERRAKKRAWRAMDEIAVFPERGKLAELDKHLLIKQIHDRAVITEETDFVIYLKAPEPIGVKALAEKLSSLRAVKHVRQASPVFYPSREKTPGTRMVLTGQIIVQFPQNYSQGDIAAIEKEYGLERLKSYGFTENTFLYDGGNPLNSLGVANRLYESGRVNYSYPDWLRFRAKEAIPNDSFFPDQWHLLNTGQGGGIAGEDIDISSVWDTYTGSTNEVIAIYDDGLEIGHEDLSPNIISGLSWDYVDDDSDPTAGEHGTSCAGVAAGRGFNAMGVTGACPFCGLVGLRANDFISDAIDAEALTYRNQTIDIYNNSWGPRDLELAGPGPLVEDALSSGTTNGRGGLGSIFVWAVGNAGNDGDNSNYNGYAN